MLIDDLWYKNAILYCLDVEKYMDANGDGVCDFEGLSRRLEFEIIKTSAPEVLAMRYDWRNTSLLTLHNFADQPRKPSVKVGIEDGALLVDVFDRSHSRAGPNDCHEIEQEPYGHRWFRVGAVDNAMSRSTH
jgi:hypothetical protein